ncbi:unnamed protein product [Notodromas monacha]|uniref:Thioredoxin domain-containing protein n=1 Tax=Notodromas monacha TaxID=399045 RepID=A0A7R9BEM9_9CRUS|nr:unnamed protein product [Notodromas monacha]CAG0913977.1 unnamed protein product [Notodromas monacha]
MKSVSVCQKLVPVMSLTTAAIRRLTTILHVQTSRHFTRTLAAGQSLCKFVDFKTEDDFVDSVMYSLEPVIVNFHADWCEPCHVLTPRLRSLVGSKSKLKLCVVNIGEFPELVREFEIQAVPAVIAVKKGRIVDQFVGLVDEEKIREFLSRLEETDDPAESSS